MPIRLNEPKTVKTYSPEEGVVFSYRESGSSNVLRSIRASADKEGKPDAVLAQAEIVARHVTAVEGVHAADGTPIAWPEAHADRMTIVEALPFDLVFELSSRINARAKEAADSGKDSARS